LFGPQDYSMRVWIKTDQLTGLGLTTGDVISAVQSENVQAAVVRPVMMTSFAFILGLVPLVTASGASKLAFRNVCTPVFGWRHR
jgi:multidrug efflux pump subunit AcrB